MKIFILYISILNLLESQKYISLQVAQRKKNDTTCGCLSRKVNTQYYNVPFDIPGRSHALAFEIYNWLGFFAEKFQGSEVITKNTQIKLLDIKVDLMNDQNEKVKITPEFKYNKPYDKSSKYSELLQGKNVAWSSNKKNPQNFIKYQELIRDEFKQFSILKDISNDDYFENILEEKMIKEAAEFQQKCNEMKSKDEKINVALCMKNLIKTAKLIPHTQTFSVNLQYQNGDKISERKFYILINIKTKMVNGYINHLPTGYLFLQSQLIKNVPEKDVSFQVFTNQMSQKDKLEKFMSDKGIFLPTSFHFSYPEHSQQITACRFGHSVLKLALENVIRIEKNDKSLSLSICLLFDYKPPGEITEQPTQDDPPKKNKPLKIEKPVIKILRPPTDNPDLPPVRKPTTQKDESEEEVQNIQISDEEPPYQQIVYVFDCFEFKRAIDERLFKESNFKILDMLSLLSFFIQCDNNYNGFLIYKKRKIAQINFKSSGRKYCLLINSDNKDLTAHECHDKPRFQTNMDLPPQYREEYTIFISNLLFEQPLRLFYYLLEKFVINDSNRINNRDLVYYFLQNYKYKNTDNFILKNDSFSLYAYWRSIGENQGQVNINYYKNFNCLETENSYINFVYFKKFPSTVFKIILTEYDDSIKIQIQNINNNAFIVIPNQVPLYGDDIKLIDFLYEKLSEEKIQEIYHKTFQTIFDENFSEIFENEENQIESIMTMFTNMISDDQEQKAIDLLISSDQQKYLEQTQNLLNFPILVALFNNLMISSYYDRILPSYSQNILEQIKLFNEMHSLIQEKINEKEQEIIAKIEIQIKEKEEEKQLKDQKITVEEIISIKYQIRMEFYEQVLKENSNEIQKLNEFFKFFENQEINSGEFDPSKPIPNIFGYETVEDWIYQIEGAGGFEQESNFEFEKYNTENVIQQKNELGAQQLFQFDMNYNNDKYLFNSNNYASALFGNSLAHQKVIVRMFYNDYGPFKSLVISLQVHSFQMEQVMALNSYNQIIREFKKLIIDFSQHIFINKKKFFETRNQVFNYNFEIIEKVVTRAIEKLNEDFKEKKLSICKKISADQGRLQFDVVSSQGRILSDGPQFQNDRVLLDDCPENSQEMITVYNPNNDLEKFNIKIIDRKKLQTEENYSKSNNYFLEAQIPKFAGYNNLHSMYYFIITHLKDQISSNSQPEFSEDNLFFDDLFQSLLKGGKSKKVELQQIQQKIFFQQINEL